jgi:hypothetical protein
MYFVPTSENFTHKIVNTNMTIAEDADSEMSSSWGS